MHSKKSSNPMQRITPYLITLGLGLGLSIPAYAAQPETSDEMQAEVPAATIDSNYSEPLKPTLHRCPGP